MTHRQPNAKYAPILLCHICSYWCAVALRIPRLWGDLFHVLRIYAEVPNHILLSKGIYKGDLDFLPWWKLNIGSVHLRLWLIVQSMKENPGSKVPRHLNIDIDFAWHYEPVQGDPPSCLQELSYSGPWKGRLFRTLTSLGNANQKLELDHYGIALLRWLCKIGQL
ncbi:hypothetical protein GALMADRAFT_210583 [Galerina marginata CBS 339.88]|uniref:F-box domain-containing protein n=1 Tax=Galerina marginata (strain CBS 339.88) TaxID=685588 RepID=A0A067T0K5_GALM3|nr:hypothetical protein GALMADRAFT_210583 [Galerina marginata CBS 339.88]